MAMIDKNRLITGPSVIYTPNMTHYGEREPDDTSLYFREAYVPEYLAHSESYMYAFRDRLKSLMEMQDYSIVQLGEPFILSTPDCPPAPGMVTVRVEAVVREFDSVIPMSGL
jgi:hypothetical protein